MNPQNMAVHHTQRTQRSGGVVRPMNAHDAGLSASKPAKKPAAPVVVQVAQHFTKAHQVAGNPSRGV